MLICNLALEADSTFDFLINTMNYQMNFHASPNQSSRMPKGYCFENRSNLSLIAWS